MYIYIYAYLCIYEYIYIYITKLAFLEPISVGIVVPSAGIVVPRSLVGVQALLAQTLEIHTRFSLCK